MKTVVLKRLAGCGAALLSVSGLLFAGSCTGDPTTASVRSLERAGRVAFVCLGQPGSSGALRSLDACTNERRESNRDFGEDETAAHVYALITLETRGEVAVVDLTSKASNVIDQDPITPGETSLPVGANPVDIVATPKGTAVFVASAEIARPGLFALPSERLRGCEASEDRCAEAPETIASWPACRLSSAPGSMVLVADPADENGDVRTSCDGSYEPLADGGAFGSIDAEGLGRQKLYVTLPREGAIAVVDAQALLDRDPGSFDDCPVESTLVLSGNARPTRADLIEQQPGCAVPAPPVLRPIGGYAATPAGLALVQPPGGTPGATGARLYVADLSAPKIHLIDLADPCAPREDDARALLPTSAEDPTRAVFTDRVGVSGITPSNRRYLYAIDYTDKSVMAFDVSDGENRPEPLRTAHPEWNPFQPEDRIRFGAAPVDVTILERDDPESIATGVTPLGTMCDPDPNAEVCSSTSTSCDLGTLYRTTSDFQVGAGPFTLRGVFAVVALASGHLAVIDIEDFDAPCRGPDAAGGAGCDSAYTGGVTTNEPSCGVVVPHQPRSAYYLLSNDDVGRHEPGIQSFPVLSKDDGTVIPETDGPHLAVPLASGAKGRLAVGGDTLEIPEDGVIVDDQGPRNTIALNLENPRVHQADQAWAITYQGALPGFGDRVADLNVSEGLFVDSTARFCELGVQSEQAVRDGLVASGLSAAEIDAQAVRFADRVHIAEALTTSDNTYWDTAACSFQDCRATFGEASTPTASRDLRVIEAFQDKLEIAPPDAAAPELVECCFPTLVDYEVRPGDEWVLIGNASGFLHSTIATPVSGECRPSCDPRLSLRQSRLRHVVEDGSTNALSLPFVNALFSVSILVPPDGPQPERDMAFRFQTQASFLPIRGALTSDSRANFQAQQLGYVPATDEIFVTDGALEGILLVPGDLVGDIRQFF